MQRSTAHDPVCPDENEIQAFVAGALGDPASEAIEVHLGECAACRALLLALPPGTAPTELGPGASAHAHAPLARGATVGRYLVLDRLGQGGMGVVYSAYDPQLDRRIALKLIRADARGGREVIDHLRTRLLREAQAMARLGHPNVVAVHDVGAHDDEVFVAMELVEGETLASWLRAPRTPREILSMFVAAGRGLDAAHASGMVHRDFKPDNVLVGRDGRPRVADFGLARAIAGDDDAQPPASPAPPASPVSPLPVVTETGILVGTPDYMAPEQLLLRRTDARCDQFAFCVALSEALGGERPFAGLALDARLKAIAHGPPPSRRRAGPRIGRALARGLRFDPSARWSSMSALLATLERATRPRWRRVAPVIAAITAAIAVAAVAIAATRAPARDAPPMCEGGPAELGRVWNAPRRAALVHALRDAPQGAALLDALDRFGPGWVSMDGESCRATRVLGTQSEELLDLRTQCLRDELLAIDNTIDLATSDPRIANKAAAVAASLPNVGACADAVALRAGARVPDDPASRTRREQQKALLARAKVLSAAGDPSDTIALATAVLASAETDHAPDIVADAGAQLGGGVVRLGHSDAALAILDRAQRAALEAHRDDLLALDLIQRCFVVGYSRNDAINGRPWCELAGAVIQRLPDRIVVERRRWHVLAAVADAAVDLPAAERAAWMELALVQPSDSDAASQLIEAFDDLGNALGREGQNARALDAHDRALAIATALGPIALDDAGNIYFNRSQDLANLGRRAEAEQSMRRALQLDERTLSPDNPDTVSARIALSDLLEQNHEYDEAAALLEKDLPLAEKVRVEDDIGVREVLRLWAIAEAGRGHAAAARELIARWRRETGKPLPDDLRAIAR